MEISYELEISNAHKINFGKDEGNKSIERHSRR
jgi:hypothetical protein